jgi:hypothetical protein
MFLKIFFIIVPFFMVLQNIFDKYTYEKRIKVNKLFEDNFELFSKIFMLFIITKIIGFASYFSNKYGSSYTILDFFSFCCKIIIGCFIIYFITEAYCFYTIIAYYVIIMCLILEKKINGKKLI